MARFVDSLGNHYSKVPPAKSVPGPRGSKSGRKIGRKKRQPSFQRWKARNPITKKE